jgi:hypothetical protein
MFGKKPGELELRGGVTGRIMKGRVEMADRGAVGAEKKNRHPPLFW